MKPVREVMQRQVVSVAASSSLREFADGVSAHHRHAAFPVYEGRQLLGAIPVGSLGRVAPNKWPQTSVRELTDRGVAKISPDSDLMEALRLLMTENGRDILLVTSNEGKLESVLTKTDILSALKARSANGGSGGPE